MHETRGHVWSIQSSLELALLGSGIWLVCVLGSTYAYNSLNNACLCTLNTPPNEANMMGLLWSEGSARMFVILALEIWNLHSLFCWQKRKWRWWPSRHPSWGRPQVYSKGRSMLACHESQTKRKRCLRDSHFLYLPSKHDVWSMNRSSSALLETWKMPFPRWHWHCLCW